MNKKLKKQIKKIMSRPYAYAFIPPTPGERCQDWFGYIVEFPGCMTQDSTLKKTYKSLRYAMAGWIEIMLIDGNKIPRPQGE